MPGDRVLGSGAMERAPARGISEGLRSLALGSEARELRRGCMGLSLQQAAVRFRSTGHGAWRPGVAVISAHRHTGRSTGRDVK
jgi:hypothetical protein